MGMIKTSNGGAGKMGRNSQSDNRGDSGGLNSTRLTASMGADLGSQDLTSGCVTSDGRCCKIEEFTGSEGSDIFSRGTGDKVTCVSLGGGGGGGEDSEDNGGRCGMGAFEVSSRAGRVYLYDAECNSEGLNGTMSTRGRDSNFGSRSLGAGGINVSGDSLEVGRMGKESNIEGSALSAEGAGVDETSGSGGGEESMLTGATPSNCSCYVD
jgi:hypothetical protein